MNNPYYACPSDELTLESIWEHVEELMGKVSAMSQYLSDHHDTCACENCGHLNPRREMCTVYGQDACRESSRYFCGFCLHAACMRAGNQPEVRTRIGAWLASTTGTKFLSTQHGPFTEFLEQEYATEIITEKKRRAR